MVYRGFGSSKTYSFTNILEIFKIINLSIFDLIKTVFILSGLLKKQNLQGHACAIYNRISRFRINQKP